MNTLKRILTIALCSLLLVCAIPQFSFRSEAAEVALTTEFLRSAIGYLSGYLVSKGYSISKDLSLNTDLLDETLDQSILYQFYTSYFATLKASSEVYAAEFESALKRAVNSGVFSISQDLDEFMTSYFDTLNIDNSLILGSSTTTFETVSAGETFSIQGSYKVSNDSTLYSFNVSVTPTYDYLPFISVDYSGTVINSIRIMFLPVSYLIGSSVDFYATISNNHPSGLSAYNTSSGVWSVSSGGQTLKYYGVEIIFRYNSGYQPGGFDLPDVLTSLGASNSSIFQVFSFLRAHGYYEYSNDLVSEQIEDTSNKDILSSASEVDSETGAVSGGFTMYMRDWSLFQQILRQFSSGILSWQQAIKALGLSQVQSDATPAEKEAALDKVAYPDSTYDWLTSTAWGDSLVQSVEDQVSTAHEEELSIADEASSVLNGGNQPSEEDKQKAGNAALLGSLLMWLGLWNPPGYDPDNPGDPGIPGDEPTDPNNPDYFGETIAGMSVAGSLLDDLWDSVGGSSGLGIVFTIGASFIVFSVVIGAANYIGSLGNDIESRSQSKYAAQDRAKSARQGFKVKGRKGA